MSRQTLCLKLLTFVHFLGCRCHGPSSDLYSSAKALGLLFESLFDAAFDHVRGYGGRADLPFFKHGLHW
jgi:hypothetical protein